MTPPTPTVCVVIPYLTHLWALEDCIESMGSSLSSVYIIDNSTDHAALQHSWPANVHVLPQARNVGIAASWNLGLAQGYDQTIIMSQWVRLAPAEYPRRDRMSWGLNYLVKGTRDLATPYGLTYAEQGFHLISVGRALVEKIGTFDECYFAYGEDDDFRWRMNLANLGGSMGQWADPGPAVYSIGYGIAKRTPGAIDRSGTDTMTSGAYWRLKWGSGGSNEPVAYTTPFGNPNHTLSYWPNP